MITKQQLSEIISEQFEVFQKKKLVERQVYFPVESSRIIIVSGVRRCGKSTLIRQKLLDSGKTVYLN